MCPVVYYINVRGGWGGILRKEDPEFKQGERIYGVDKRPRGLHEVYNYSGVR